eukprot:Gb_26480 [translate_table: standard]
MENRDEMDPRLHEAALSGNWMMLDTLKRENTAVLDQLTPEKNTPLHLAARAGKAEFVENLLQLKPKLSLTQNDKGNTALHEAAQVGQLDVVKVLLTRQPDLINICNEFQETPLFKAAERGHVEIVRKILEHSDPLQNVTQKTLDHRTCLHVAAVGGHRDVVKVLLRRAGDRAIQLAAAADKYGNTAVHLAIPLAAAADKYGNTALHLAVCGDHFHIVKRLLKLDPGRWCYSLNKNEESPLHIAVKLGFLETAKLIIKYKPDCIEVRSKDGKNIVHLATETSQVNILKYLVKNVDVSELINQQDGDGNTPLHIAANMKSSQIVEKLLKVPGVNKHAQNNIGLTPLEVARENTEYYGSYRILERLVNYPPRSRPFLYSTPNVTAAKHKNCIEMIKDSFTERAESELVVAGLLATVSFTAAFTVPGGFADDGAPILISRLSFKIFMVLNTVAFFLSLFVVLMWQWSSPISTGDMMFFMSCTSLLVCGAFVFIAHSFVAAVYVVLSRKVKTLAWSLLGISLFFCFCGDVVFCCVSTKFLVKRARIQCLLGVPRIEDKFVRDVWKSWEKCGLLDNLRMCEQKFDEFMSGQKFL